MDEDLSNTLEDFIIFKKIFFKEQQYNAEYRATIENLQKQNQHVNDILKLDGSKCGSEHERAVKEQKTNGLILELKGENLKLRKLVKDLEGITLELKTEKVKLENHNTELKRNCSKELQDMKMNYETKIQTIENELKKQLQECQKKLDERACDMKDEINMLILEYEEKLQKLEERLITKENENKEVQKKATADVAIYQKKVSALEHLNNELQKQRQEEMHPPSTPMMRYQQHTPAQLPTSTSANDKISSGDRGFQYHPPRKFGPGSSPCSSSAFLCSPTDFQPDTTSAPLQNKQPRGRSRPNISKRNIADANSRVTLSRVESVVQETSIVSKTTRFSMAKKRKLFSNNQNTLL